MARAQRNNVDYFPFICSEGNKMFYLEETYGNDGFAVFVKLLRELARTNYHYLDLSKSSKIMFLSAKCKVSITVLNSIINDLVELEKFDKELWEENKIIWCQDFIDSIQDAYKKRSNNCIDKNSLLTLLVSKGIRKPSKSIPKPSKSIQSSPVGTQRREEKRKEEYRKEKESIENRKSEFENSLLPFQSKYGLEMLEDFFGYWTEHGEKDRKMRYEKEKSFGIERRLVTWHRNQKKFEKEKNVAPKKEKINAGSIIQQVIQQNNGVI